MAHALLRAASPLLATLALLAAQPATLKVRLDTPRGPSTVDLPLERYVAGVLAGESSVFKSDAALQAMSVAARTYAIRLKGRHAAEGFDFCSTTHCQRLDLDAITPRLQSIAAGTEGELLWYEGKPAFTPYTRDCGGRTEDAAIAWPDLAAPYLKSHPDPYCIRAGTDRWQWNADPARILEALRAAGLKAPPALATVAILTRTAIRPRSNAGAPKQWRIHPRQCRILSLRHRPHARLEHSP